MQTDTTSPATRPAAEAAPAQNLRFRLVTYLVTGSMFMEVLDGNIIATALPEMGRSFGVDAVSLNVAMSAYLLALAAFIPVSGWIADRLGARRVFAFAIASFTLSSVLCGLVDNLHAFIALRVLQGASGALMVPVGRLLVLRNTPASERMAAMANLVWPALVAPVIAPPLGGFIVHQASWHWIFFLNLPLGILAFALALWLIPVTPPTPRPRFDWIGFLLSGSGIFVLLSGLERIASQADVTALAVTAAGAVLLAASLRHFRRVEGPMLDLAPFSIPTFRAVMFGGSISRMAIGSVPFLLPLMFQLGFGLNAFHAGLYLLVLFAGNLGMKSFSTGVLRRFGYRPVMLVNGVITAAFIAICALLTPDTPLWLLLPVLLLAGMTRSMQFTCFGTLAFADVPDRQLADANGLFNVISQLSLATGITLGAMSVRLGEWLVATLHFTARAAEYKVAFIVAALVALAGLLDTLRLPRGAGDHFVSRRR